MGLVNAGVTEPTEITDANASQTLGAAADRALVFQGYLLRRAWGVYYAIWAGALAAYVLFPASIATRIPGFSLPEALAYYGVLVAITLVGVWATSWTLGQTYRAIRFREARGARPGTYRWFGWILVVGLVVFALVVSTAFVSSFAGLLVLDASLAAINLSILLAVRRTFPRVPAEGLVAVVTFAVGVVGSAVALVATHNQTWFSLPWIVPIVGWAFCAVYALYHAPEELAVGADA